MNGFSDFFSSLFGGAAPGSPPQEEDAGSLEITVEEAFAGARRRVTLMEGGRPKQLEVQVPAGIADGQSLRVGRTGRAALRFRVKVRPHPLYAVNGKDVQIELPLAPWEAALGTKVPVPTLGGTVELTIPPGAQSGQKLRLRGRGLPASPNGDQFVVIKLVTPAGDTREAREAYERMKRDFKFDARAGWP
jgi:curved DNA-binding protein